MAIVGFILLPVSHFVSAKLALRFALWKFKATYLERVINYKLLSAPHQKD